MELLGFLDKAGQAKRKEYTQRACNAAEKGFPDEVEFCCFFANISGAEKHNLMRTAWINSANQAKTAGYSEMGKRQLAFVATVDDDYKKYIAQTEQAKKPRLGNIIFAVRKSR
jgi:hypothetical protein